MEDDGWKSKLAIGLMDNVPLLLVGLGSILVLLGLTTGIHGWLAIELPWARWVAVILGVLLIITGAITSRFVSRPLSRGPFKVKISHPEAGSEVRTFVMKGTIAKAPPQGYILRIIKHYAKGWRPIGTVHVNGDDTWVSSSCWIGGEPGESIRVSVVLLGPAAQIVADYYEDARSAFDAVVNYARPFPQGAEPYFPGIREYPPDLIECESINYRRDKS